MSDWKWDELKPRKKKSRILQRIEEEDEKLTSGKSAVTHSLLYHRYFEDYSETKVLLPNGRSRIVREYVGSYYSRRGSDRAWILMKLVYACIFLAALFLYIYPLIRIIAANTVWYTALPGLLSAIPVVILFATLCSCTFSKRKLTKYGFSLFSRLMMMSLITAGMIALYGICTIIFMILNPQYVSETIPSTVMAFAAAMLFASIALIEYNTRYDSTESTRTPDPDSIVIS